MPIGTTSSGVRRCGAPHARRFMLFSKFMVFSPMGRAHSPARSWHGTSATFNARGSLASRPREACQEELLTT